MTLFLLTGCLLRKEAPSTDGHYHPSGITHGVYCSDKSDSYAFLFVDTLNSTYELKFLNNNLDTVSFRDTMTYYTPFKYYNPRLLALNDSIGARLIANVDHVSYWDLFPDSTKQTAGSFAIMLNIGELLISGHKYDTREPIQEKYTSKAAEYKFNVYEIEPETYFQGKSIVQKTEKGVITTDSATHTRQRLEMFNTKYFIKSHDEGMYLFDEKTRQLISKENCLR